MDAFNRPIEHVRLSVTDRRHRRCQHRLPDSFHDFQEPAAWLDFDEIERVIRAFAGLGVRRSRLSSGEPLTRCDLPGLSARPERLPGAEDLSSSANAVQFKRNEFRERSQQVVRFMSRTGG